MLAYLNHMFDYLNHMFTGEKTCWST